MKHHQPESGAAPDGASTPIRRRRALIGAAGATLLLAGAGRVAAQATQTAQSAADYPSRPVRVVVPFPPGGLSDALGRLYGKELSERFGQPFVLDHKPGAATNIGAALVAQAPADGHTLLITTIATNALNRWSNRKLSFDPHGFTEVGMLGVNTLYLMVAADSPLRSVADVVRAARESPRGLSYGSFGAGGPNHLIAEKFRQATGITRLLHVPYKGAQDASADLIGGRIDFMIDGATINLVHSGKLRALAVCFPQRWPTQPDVPTMAEAGYPDVTISTYFGVAAPPGTPAPVADKLNEALRAIAMRPDIQQRLLALNVMAKPADRAESLAFMRAQSDKWGPILQAMDIKTD